MSHHHVHESPSEDHDEACDDHREGPSVGHHAHHHSHSHGAPGDGDGFRFGVVVNVAIVAVEIVGGVAANSVALLADASHNLTDVLALLLAWGAVWLARRRPTQRRTYGFGRSSILAALANAVIMLVTVGAIAAEAVMRVLHPEPVVGGIVMAVASLGIVGNGVVALMFMRGRAHDLNRRGVFLHMAADAGISLGVVMAAAAIAVTGWNWLDPVISLVINGLIVAGTWSMLREAMDLALDAVPVAIDRGDVEAYLRSLPGVSEVHDLHIWGLSTTEAALTAHLVRPEAAVDDELLADAALVLEKRFGIGHATIQIECGAGGTACRLAPADVI
ncbi:MAG: cation diffusion facilitator family transporter [Azospirillaceae bacterium]|nr:cation diffusion facilitator family transporter [Azospirillaceae bacterium]